MLLKLTFFIVGVFFLRLRNKDFTCSMRRKYYYNINVNKT